MSADLPWFRFYATDWLSDPATRSMTPAQKGVYVDLLALAWQEGGVDKDPVLVRRILGLAAEPPSQREGPIYDGETWADWVPEAHLEGVLDRFSEQVDGGFWSHPKLEEIRRGVDARRDAGRVGGVRSGRVRRRKAADSKGKERPAKQPRSKRSGASNQPEPESEPEVEDVRGACTNCDEGKVVDDKGTILACCSCPAGRARALWYAKDRAAEEESEARKAEDAKRGRRATGPTPLGKGLDDTLNQAKPKEA